MSDKSKFSKDILKISLWFAGEFCMFTMLIWLISGSFALGFHAAAVIIGVLAMLLTFCGCLYVVDPGVRN